MNEHETATATPDDIGDDFEPIGTATYSPEDNKLRFYAPHRIDTPTYERLKAAGFVWAAKQAETAGVATLMVAPRWTIGREDLLIELCGEIGDEDYSPTERSADRAERFDGYREKRSDEAHAHADTFASGPAVFGHQSRARAERLARRHDRHRGRAVNQWEKAEYWQERTRGVISHALYKTSAHVRRGRIKELEADLRAVVASYTPTDDPPHIINQQAYDYHLGEYRHGGAKVPHAWVGPKGRGGRWVELSTLPAIEQGSARYRAHLEHRLTYERAMLAEEGGAASETEMEPGGWIRGGTPRMCLNNAAAGWKQIHKVNRSATTGRVVSVAVEGTTTGYTRESGYTKQETRPCMVNVNVERMGADSYRAPTDEERAAFATEKKAKKANTPKAPPLVNPTREDAERLQAYLNARAAKTARERGRMPSDRAVEEWTQPKFSRGLQHEHTHITTFTLGGESFKARMRHRGYSDYQAPDSVIILTDKPQKPFPVDWSRVEAPDLEPATV